MSIRYWLVNSEMVRLAVLASGILVFLPGMTFV